MLLGVALVPRQHEHAFQGGERAGKALRRIVERLRPGQRERIAAAAERPLLAENLALEGGLLNVARRRRDALLLQQPPQPRCPALDHAAVDTKTVFPPRMLGPLVDPRRLDSR